MCMLQIGSNSKHLVHVRKMTWLQEKFSQSALDRGVCVCVCV